MILDTTYSNKVNIELINDLVGKPYSIIKSIRMKGIGSKRMIIEEVSPNMKQYINVVDDASYANIELRPLGILIRINKALKNYTWVIPYYQLVIYKTNLRSIHAQGRYIRFKNSITLKENKLFFNKLLDLKAKYEEQYSVKP
ncbi:hypothetical protein ACFQ1R_12580 [Mariniflexile jejuense]|uniref:Arginyl-tRNA synthetase n=1 Tax=Mariniflexile jejuense TaxID=1173582 RepID=A0ABW3JN19_9FLAO